MTSEPDVTQLLEETASGNRQSADRLFGVVYQELRKIASSQMASEPINHTLQSTALVHEVWMKLVVKKDSPGWKNREHFFATVATAMRRILVDSARARRRLKRGGDNKKVPIEEQQVADKRFKLQQDCQLLALDESLDELRKSDEVKARLVELRYFAGLTNAEAAEQLGVSTATAERYWAFARAWLKARMETDT